MLRPTVKVKKISWALPCSSLMNISDGWVLHRPTSSFTSTKSLTRSLESTKMWRQFLKTWPGLVTPIVSQESWLSRLKMLVENLTLFGLFIITWASVPCLDFLILLEPFDHCWAIRWLIQLGPFLGPPFLWWAVGKLIHRKKVAPFLYPWILEIRIWQIQIVEIQIW